jgi:transcriptional regulator with XRE-family HTH domain
MTGKELKALRKKTGLSRERFAVEVACVSSATIWRWERDGVPIRDSDFVARRAANRADGKDRPW